MTPEERRRARLDRVIAEMNRRDPGMYAALQPVTEDDPEEPDELDDPKTGSTK